MAMSLSQQASIGLEDMSHLEVARSREQVPDHDDKEVQPKSEKASHGRA